MAKRKVFSIGSSLSDGLEQTIAAAHNYSNDLRIDVIPLKKIETDPENPRLLSLSLQDIVNGLSQDDPKYDLKIEEIAGLQSLALSIEDQGIINPIVVYEYNGMYRLIAGERRTLASALAKKSDIQAKILDGRPTELKIRILQWIENIERSDLSLTERMDNLEKMVHAFAKQQGTPFRDVKITDISKLIGCAKSHAINLKAVLNADDQIKELIACNKIKNLEKAALLTHIQSNFIKQRAIEECINGATLKRLKNFLEQDKNQTLVVEPVNTYGREQKTVHFGSTKNIHVARVVLDSIFQNESLSDLTHEIRILDLDNPRIIAQTFKILIRKLEQLHE
ncbi:MAG: ParB/RepB/Spo0J family partition protein [Legionellaceae bacterium]|nr:ParB/RepB/Spo0J family partition protein [Legionellaceae bacterium]